MKGKRIKNNKLYKKIPFWLIIIIIILLIIIISYIKKQKEIEKSIINTLSASDFIAGIENAKSHIDEFSYNNTTGKTEYIPKKITLEMYNRIREDMNEDDVICILGSNEVEKLEAENTYILTWGDMEMKKGYWIQIIFDKDKKVVSKSEIGLK